ncbi:MAG: methionine--tRNA ligase [Patescibacteria group bacterium]
MPKAFYVTTTIPYVNSDPHIGFALEVIAADVIARYHRLLGEDVIFNTGTDEHGQKIWQKAIDEGCTPQEYVDDYAARFKKLEKLLNLSNDRFIRTTSEKHKEAAQEFWNRVDKNGYIYKKNYKVKYCVGCELEKTDSELEDGKCSLHPNKELENREEENYFFKFSEFEKPLLEFYEANPKFVQPEGKFKEIKSFVAGGLKDFSISRLKEKMPWGIAVPGDDEHVMYVWFDALINYISTLGWSKDKDNFEKYWPVVQLAGKDNLRQQSAMWQAMLIAADLANSKKILINGFISVDGQKMSKSLGNVISPSELVERYSIDGARYLIMHLGPFGGDMDVSWEKLDTIYTADLSNGLGNLCSRVAKMCEKIPSLEGHPDTNVSRRGMLESQKFHGPFAELMYEYELQGSLAFVSKWISLTDEFLSDKQPWKLEGEEQIKVLQEAVKRILQIAYHLQPFMPETAEKILKHFSSKKITAMEPMFPRLK